MIEYENLSRLNEPYRENLREVFNEVLARGSFILGNAVEGFERSFASYCDSKYCAGVGNGLDALTMALRSFSFEMGSEVIVPSNTYIASILAILNNNLIPILVEPDPATCNLDPCLAEEAVTNRTVAIIAVHLYGKCCAMDDIGTLAKKYQLKLIEDCAHAHGAKFKGKSAGTFGEFGAFSFYPTKNLGALGDAGAVITEDKKLDEKIRLLRNYGAAEKDHHEVIGTNSRLDELHAAFLQIKLKSLEVMNEKRRKLATLYNRGLDDRVIKPMIHDDYLDVYHVYNIRHSKRDALRDYLRRHGVQTMVHYPIPPHKQNALKGMFNMTYPISEEIHATTLSLPISPIHSENEILQVIEIINKF